MLLKIGELARQCGLTVRTLHHYDDIGLLTPSARTESGYRLYDRTDIARLYQIQALQRFGLSLAGIGAFLAGTDLPLASLVDKQLHMLEDQIQRATRLHERLSRLRDQLTRGEEPELADWLTTLESMTMYDKYFSEDELERLAFLYPDTREAAEWRDLAAEVREALERNVTPREPEAQVLARRWMALLERDTAGSATLFAKLDEMYLNEPSLQERIGISPEMRAFILEASQEIKLAVFERCLTPEEFRFVRENYGKRMREWPPLIGEVHAAMKKGTAPDDPRMRALCLRWLDLFRSYATDNPETQAKIRLALEREPDLKSSWIDAEFITYLRRGMAALNPA
ncbi:MerR family transcriptional regulator [Trinickia terrae]|uniref:MerR family transcriptional regulator n=1 Tax=Trinickia terrae TaxID=2571161 RepID=A0A4V5PIC5_9BURK|nr:MerR family transcriptional regulator [Trinickia terrae]TKC86850.1 MerR family transcriptional regulator [Trinickia terrae]